MQITAVILLIIIVSWFFWQSNKKKKIVSDFTESFRFILEKNVSFYQSLNEAERLRFENKMQQFLERVKITGIHTAVEDEDRVFVAASAIIPIFAFANWEYNNLNEVLLYPDSFSEEFELQDGKERPVLGMVGNGAMQHVMILSQPSLRQGFTNKTDKSNTAIHEFVHLIDKTDGEIDGIPESLLSKQYTIPWINMIHQNLKEILDGNSDINPYGATNQGEFFAVVAEYFFERPDLLQSKHPELYKLLEKIFCQHPNDNI
jgi:MtfA peptidase